MSTDDILRKRQRASLVGGSNGVTSSWPGTSSVPQPPLQVQGEGSVSAAAGSAPAGIDATHGDTQAGKQKPATKVARLGGPQVTAGAAGRASAQSEAQRRLAALHAMSGKAGRPAAEAMKEAAGPAAVLAGVSAAPAGQVAAAGAAGGGQARGVPLPVLSPDGVLTSSQRLYHMSPAIIPADYMRRAGHFGNQISQAVQGYNRCVLL